MSAWGTGSFDNDGALDFLADYREGTAAVVETVLRDIANLDDGTYIEADAGQAAMVAGEVIAACHDNPSEALDEDMLADLQTHRAAVVENLDLIDYAVTAIPKVLASETSEVAEFWENASPEDAEKFQNNAADLLTRLGDIV
ncbi:hypothetical protein FHS72_001781 [Loktanella ponticola]|uniref:DUF4259 domain-containing protein n=1 Tax=Yoonia ponticola TaxID=1524255 RepID=A0A7W9BKD8_9RHOB|nr:DUF4259 domain-containing protein [Yoonia ponticola]MBB5722157.1 hypothetical protein [Yoonia ponticola]